MNYYAHTAEDAAGNPLPESYWQKLHDHLKAVAELIVRFATELGLEDGHILTDARITALLHDLGKYREAFQQYLRKNVSKSSETQHAIYGAALAFEREWLAAAFAVAGHHAGLHDFSDLVSAVENAKAREDIAALLRLHETESKTTLPASPDIPAHITRAEKISETAAALATEFYTRMIFSCLVDADRLNSANWQKSTPPDATPLNPQTLLDRVLAERDRKRTANPDSPLSATRNRIFDACLDAATLPQGFFSLTVTTGGGKTLSGMAFALAHARQHKLRRVIVVIPYLSIIEQNAAEYRRALDPENTGIVLENHSSVKPAGNTTAEDTSRLELLAENWDAPVVVTTSVQFIESLFAASPTRARKLHNIARSVVIFDEVQTLPTHLLAPMFSVFRELTQNYGVTFVFSSATQPAFRHSNALPDGFHESEIREIAPAPAALFHQLRRVNYHLHPAQNPVTWDALSEKFAAANSAQVLCVVNLTRHANEFWNALLSRLTDLAPDRHLSPTDRPIHLSSTMCPAHRLALIRHIKRRLKAGLSCRVVSTQLIEAGVDVDFPGVWRAMGPLDSIVQVAGRCNREGKLADATGNLRNGEVHVFTPADNKLPPGIYSTATDQSAVTLASLGADAAERLAIDPKIFRDYFHALYSMVNTDYVGTKNGKKETTIQEDRQNLYFRTVAEKAKVISDDGQPVVIPIGKARHLIAKIRARAETLCSGEKRFTGDDLRRLQRYMVNVRTNNFALLRERNLIRPLLPNLEIFVLNEGLYHKELGLLVGDRPFGDFIS
jgi:CRISPR-associated endonuclease/helicase Cas3